jgi:hypothetical protein
MVHRRDSENVAAMKQFLHSLDLRVVDWEEAVAQTGRANPYVGDVLDVGFAMADAVLVVFTPDDIVRLRPDLITESDGPDEREERVSLGRTSSTRLAWHNPVLQAERQLFRSVA